VVATDLRVNLVALQIKQIHRWSLTRMLAARRLRVSSKNGVPRAGHVRSRSVADPRRWLEQMTPPGASKCGSARRTRV